MVEGGREILLPVGDLSKAVVDGKLIGHQTAEQVVVRLGVNELASREQGDGAVHEGGGIFGLELEGAAKGRDGGGVIVKLDGDGALVEQRADVAGRELELLVEHRQRFLEAGAQE